ncbi:hypothetical protein RGQ29_025339 [Quercus rubra]|uniref:NADH dehydrogenase [ubiquinone] 1 alpha subcomplex subunit 1 n=1 Tax=Quercus rubra TaxID=3512 RepID=A0AAN7EXM0_QUERU|nr:hypothetical protein RGQ29_025339 [Quercus rubra]
MSWRWLEAALPLGIIAGLLCTIGQLEYRIHRAYHGRPKHVGGDDLWDKAMVQRDKKVIEKFTAASHN